MTQIKPSGALGKKTTDIRDRNWNHHQLSHFSQFFSFSLLKKLIQVLVKGRSSFWISPRKIFFLHWSVKNRQSSSIGRWAAGKMCNPEKFSLEYLGSILHSPQGYYISVVDGNFQVSMEIESLQSSIPFLSKYDKVEVWTKKFFRRNPNFGT